jgi:hypothetical protein
MKNLFEGLANQNNAKATYVAVKDTSGLRVSGLIKIIKGALSVDLNYWGEVWKSKYEGYVSLDDWDYDMSNTYISDVKIDSLSKFNEALKNMGLSSVADSLKISEEDIKEQVYLAVANSPSVKKFYDGKVLFTGLTFEQKRKIVLDYSISNYDKAQAWELNNLGLSESPSTLPSLEELTKLSKQL